MNRLLLLALVSSISTPLLRGMEDLKTKLADTQRLLKVTRDELSTTERFCADLESRVKSYREENRLLRAALDESNTGSSLLENALTAIVAQDDDMHEMETRVAALTLLIEHLAEESDADKRHALVATASGVLKAKKAD